MTSPSPWMAQAECADSSPDLFFPETPGPENCADAKAICAVCPVRVQCLHYAMTHRMAGVWGGTSEADRRRIRRKRLPYAGGGGSAA